MPDEPLLTVRELAEHLSLPESTVRHDRYAFLDHVPAVGTGRRRRGPAALAEAEHALDGAAERHGVNVLALREAVRTARGTAEGPR